MKNKLLRFGFLGIVGLAISAGVCDAGFFKHLCCNKCCTTICCRPYNAFTPFCYGGMVCDGCCPTPMCAFNGCGPVSGNCGMGCGMGQPGMGYPGVQPMPAGNPVGNPGYAPMPAPTQNTTYMQQQYYPVQPAGYYQPGYYQQPVYPMQYYYPVYPQAPSPYYWGYGR